MVFFDDFTSLVPNSWINFTEFVVNWPPFNVKKEKMKFMVPNEQWTKKSIKKHMGPFGMQII